jgi:protein ImuB
MPWAALRVPSDTATPPTDAQRHLATWTLLFTPKVAHLEDPVVLDVEASTRLFGGKRALRARVYEESKELGCSSLAWTSNSLAALCLARAGVENGFKRPLPELLDAHSHWTS